MKNLGLGLLLGATSGLILSLIKDENGNRLGKPLKVNAEAINHEVSNLKDSIANAKTASHKLAGELPEARRAVSDITDDVRKYQRHSQNDLDEMKYRVNQINNHLASDKEEKKN